MPGIGKAELDVLKHALPNLPASYLDCISQVEVYGKVLGYCVLYPEAWDEGKGLAHALCEANVSDENPHTELMAKAGLVQVADFEAMPIFVCIREPSAGAVLVLWNEHDETLRLAAESFEEFLILAANFEESSALDGSSSEMRYRLDEIELKDEVRRTWRDLCEDQT